MPSAETRCKSRIIDHCGRNSVGYIDGFDECGYRDAIEIGQVERRDQGDRIWKWRYVLAFLLTLLFEREHRTRGFRRRHFRRSRS